MTAREVLRLHGAFHRSPRPADELLSLVGLDGAAGRTRYRRLSGGERQRLGLALALVGRPELVALDEPTAGMDVEGRAATRELLRALRGDGVTVLLTSHDLADVEQTADRLAILDRGRIVALGVAAGARGRRRCADPVPARDSPLPDGSRRPCEPAAGRRRRGGRFPRRRGRGPLRDRGRGAVAGTRRRADRLVRRARHARRGAAERGREPRGALPRARRRRRTLGGRPPDASAEAAS